MPPGDPGVREPEVGVLAAADHVAALLERVAPVRAVVQLQARGELTVAALRGGRLVAGLRVRVRRGRLAVRLLTTGVTALVVAGLLLAAVLVVTGLLLSGVATLVVARLTAAVAALVVTGLLAAVPTLVITGLAALVVPGLAGVPALVVTGLLLATAIAALVIARLATAVPALVVTGLPPP